MNNPIQDYELIKLVESHPILYDKDMSRGTKNAYKKDEAWRQVSLELNASERACITRWKSVRDRFGKEYRRVLENPDESVTWDMFPHLMFLKNHYKHGSAKDYDLPDIRYKPKLTKLRVKPLWDLKEKSNNEEEQSIEDEYVNRCLIQLVKDREVIYDKLKIRNSKNLTAKNDAWQEISDSMGISEETCYKRWKKLRDRFARECRNHQIYPDKPVEWEYFNDMMFLEGHYRKGIPLDIHNLKRCGRPPKNANRKVAESKSTEGKLTEGKPTEVKEVADGTQWIDDSLNIECADVEQNIPNNSDEYAYVDYYDDKVNSSDETNIGQSEVGQLLVSTQDIARPEEQLCAVIDNIEAVLQQSQECLQSLRQQQRRDQDTIQGSQSISSDQPLIVQKMNVLLNDLDSQIRSKAEAKILKFLYECQIKSLSHEDIDDVEVSCIQ